MKKKLVQALLLSAIMISLGTSFVAPIEGHDEIIETDVAAQTKTTSTNIDLLAGISRELYEAINDKTSDCIVKIKFVEVENNVWTDGWATTKVNIRKEPSIESEILGTLSFNDYVKYYRLNEEWNYIIYKNEEIAYVHTDYISDKKNQYVDYSIPYTSGFKSYMPYTAITSKSSQQYKLQQYHAYTGTYGIRQVNGRYCVAIGTAFDIEIGTYFDLILENGTIIPCILGDVKADVHTEANNIITMHNGCASEFIVDINLLNKYAKRDGDISSCCEEWDSPVAIIRIYDKNIFEL